jgi:hypothetical protein
MCNLCKCVANVYTCTHSASSYDAQPVLENSNDTRSSSVAASWGIRGSSQGSATVTETTAEQVGTHRYLIKRRHPWLMVQVLYDSGKSLCQYLCTIAERSKHVALIQGPTKHLSPQHTQEVPKYVLKYQHSWLTSKESPQLESQLCDVDNFQHVCASASLPDNWGCKRTRSHEGFCED